MVSHSILIPETPPSGTSFALIVFMPCFKALLA
jgi:hypothetical protein